MALLASLAPLAPLWLRPCSRLQILAQNVNSARLLFYIHIICVEIHW